eukprot:scaffold2930_cov244-Pinguiococcus_pyrenoidosus.AAC.7
MTPRVPGLVKRNPTFAAQPNRYFSEVVSPSSAGIQKKTAEEQVRSFGAQELPPTSDFRLQTSDFRLQSGAFPPESPSAYARKMMPIFEVRREQEDCACRERPQFHRRANAVVSFLRSLRTLQPFS